MIDMDGFFFGAAVLLIIIIFLMLYRVFAGPTLFDRLNGISVIGIDSMLLIILVGYLEHRSDMFIDISIVYASLGFVSLVVISKYLGESGGE